MYIIRLTIYKKEGSDNMYCSNCGAEIHEGDRFCEACGAKVMHKEQSVPPAQPQMTSQNESDDNSLQKKKQKKKKNKGLIAALVTVSVIAVLAIAALVYILNSPAKEMVDKIDSGDYKEAKELCDDKIEGNSIQEMLAEKFLENYMDEMGDRFTSGKIDFSTRLEKLKAIDNLELTGMINEMGEQYADLVDDVVDLYEDRRIDYDTASSYLIQMNGISDSNEFTSEYEEACRELSIDITQTPQTEGGNTDNTDNPGTVYDDSLSDNEVYLEYIKSELLPVYGLAKEGDTYGTMSSYEDNWLNPAGMVSLYFRDLDNCGKQEMVLFLFKLQEEAESVNTSEYALYVQLYKQDENRNPYLVDEIATGAYIEDYDNCYSLYSNDYIHAFLEVSAVYVNDEIYFVFEENSRVLAFADGSTRNYWAVKYENGQLNMAFSFTQTAGGSSDFAYTGYDFTNGEMTNKELLYSQTPYGDETATYNSFSEAVSAFMGKYGIDVEPVEWPEGDSILADSTFSEEIFEFKISASTNDYMTYNMEAELDDDSVLHESVGPAANSSQGSSQSGQAKGMYEAYADIADMYLRNYNSVVSTGDPYNSEEYDNVNYLFASDILYEPDHPSFILYDLNKDGVSELFIGLCSTDDNTSTWIYDVYTYGNGGASRLMKDIGYRAGTCVLCEGGIIKDMWSSSAYESGTNFWILPSGGSALEKQNAVSYHGNFDTYEPHYYNSSDADASLEITEEQYNSIIEGYSEITIDSYELNESNISQLRNGELSDNTVY